MLNYSLMILICKIFALWFCCKPRLLCVEVYVKGFFKHWFSIPNFKPDHMRNNDCTWSMKRTQTSNVYSIRSISAKNSIRPIGCFAVHVKRLETGCFYLVSKQLLVIFPTFSKNKHLKRFWSFEAAYTAFT